MVQTERERLCAVLEVAIVFTSALSIEAYERIVGAAVKLTGARYAALGVIDQDGIGVEDFVATGLDEESVWGIGALPPST